MFAFHVEPPPGAKRLNIEFQFISPTSPGRLQIEPVAATVQWQSVLLYPAGWYARDIPVKASLRLPAGFKPASSLPVGDDGVSYKPVSLETLVDSPVFASRYTRRIDLGAVDEAPVDMDLIADDPVAFGVSDVYRAELKAMVALSQQDGLDRLGNAVTADLFTAVACNQADEQ